MKLVKELTPIDFKAWGGAVDTLARVRAEGLVDDFNALAEELFSEYMGVLFTDTKFNDWLWFDREQIYESLGIKDEE